MAASCTWFNLGVQGCRHLVRVFAAADAREACFSPEGLEPATSLRPMTEGREVIEDYRTLQLSLRAHPLSFLREKLDRMGIVRCADLASIRDGRNIEVAGVILVRQRPGSAKGVLFVTIEDETGIANGILWPDRFEIYRRQVMSASMIAIRGRLQKEGEVTREDPVRDRELKKLTENLVEQISEDKDILKAILAKQKLSYTMRGKPARELTVEDGQAALAEASRIIRDREDRKNYKAKWVAPADCSPEMLDAIAAAVAGDHDPARVRKELAGAFRIGYSIYKGKVVAVAGLGKPRAASRARLFKRIGATADPKAFRVRVDWLYLHKDHRRKGQLTRLFTKLRALVKGQSLFAVTRREDELAHELLTHLKFKPASLSEGAAESAEASEILYVLTGA